MKRLKLQLAKLEGAEVLTREKLKGIMGGDGGSGGGSGNECIYDWQCPNGEGWSCVNGTCVDSPDTFCAPPTTRTFCASTSGYTCLGPGDTCADL